MIPELRSMENEQLHQLIADAREELKSRQNWFELHWKLVVLTIGCLCQYVLGWMLSDPENLALAAGWAQEPYRKLSIVFWGFLVWCIFNIRSQFGGAATWGINCLILFSAWMLWTFGEEVEIWVMLGWCIFSIWIYCRCLYLGIRFIIWEWRLPHKGETAAEYVRGRFPPKPPR